MSEHENSPAENFQPVGKLPAAESGHDPDKMLQVVLSLFQIEASRDPKYDLTNQYNFAMLVRGARWFLDWFAWHNELDARTGQWAEEIRNLNLPDVVRFDEAMKIITRQNRLDRASERFKLFAQIYSWFDFGGAFGKWPPSKQEWRDRLAHWQKNGIPRNQVIGLHSVWNEKAFKDYCKAHIRKPKKRRPWSEKRRERDKIRNRRRRSQNEVARSR
jgi:hypothetical protein